MLYERSLEIEQRLEAVLQLIRTGKYSTPSLAQQLEVSIPTISRCVTALRARGHDIQAEKHATGWRYVLMVTAKPASRKDSHRSTSRLLSR
jgi:biotin operon repressor